MKREDRKSTEYVIGTAKILKGGVKVYTEEETFEIPMEGISEDVKLPQPGTVLKDANVALSKSGEKLYSIAPSKGSHVVRFSGFAHGKDKDPEPVMQRGGKVITMADGRKFTTRDKEVFTAILSIIDKDDPFYGLDIRWRLEYVFVKEPRTRNCMMGGGKKANAEVENFLALCGFDLAAEDIPFDDNVLPDLEQMLSERSDNQIFRVRLENGFVKEAEELEAGVAKMYLKQSKSKKQEVELDDEEEEPAPRRKTAQVTDETETPSQKERRLVRELTNGRDEEPDPRPRKSTKSEDDWKKIAEADDEELDEHVVHARHGKDSTPKLKPPAEEADDEDWDDDEDEEEEKPQPRRRSRADVM